MKVLFENGHKDLVKQLEPEFSPDEISGNLPIPVVAEQQANKSIGSKETLTVDNVRTKLKDLRSEIAECVKVSNVIHYLHPDLISAEKRDTLLEDELEYPHEACFQLIDDVISSTNPCKFIGVLYAADYPYFADMLSGKIAYQFRFKVLNRRIQLYRPYICTRIDPLNIVPYLLTEGVVNYLDREEIIATKEQFGNIQAVHSLLDCIQCRKSPTVWYTEFLDSLDACGYQDLVNLIEPDYSKDPELWKHKLEEGYDDVDDICCDKNQLKAEDEEVIKYLDQALATFADDEESIVRSELDVRLEIDKLRQDYKRKEKLLLNDLQKEKQCIAGEMQKRKELLLDIKRDCLYGNKVWSLESAKSTINAKLLRKDDERPIVIEFQPSKLLDLMEFLGNIKSNVTIEKVVDSNKSDKKNAATEKCDSGKCDKDTDVKDDAAKDRGMIGAVCSLRETEK